MIALTDQRGFPIPDVENAHTAPFTIPDLMRAAKKVRGGKAPGPNLVHNEVVKIFARENPGDLLTLYNLCWTHAAFPAR